VGDGAGEIVVAGLGVAEACPDSADFRSHPANTSPTTTVKIIRHVFMLVIWNTTRSYTQGEEEVA